MSSTDFCPYDGKSIVFNNLAYELVFAEGWDWGRVKTETSVGSEHKLYLNESDLRRQQFNSTPIESAPVILLESRTKGGKNGLGLLCNYLHRNNYRYKTTQGTARVLDYSEKNGVFSFFDQYNELVMKALPCCPHCHRRLPDGWMTADDFIGISVNAPAGFGKTAFINSLLYNDCDAFKDIVTIEGHPFHISSSSVSGDKTVFLKAELTCESDIKTLMIGLYDTSEFLTQYGTFKAISSGDEIMDRLDADIYLFDMRGMGIPGISSQRIAGRTVFQLCKLLSVKEQGRFQKNNEGKVISAAELLDFSKLPDNNKNEATDAIEFFNNFVHERQKDGQVPLSRVQFLGVITKSDLIEEKEKKGIFSPVFDRNSNGDMTDINSMTARNEMVQELMRKYHMLDDNTYYNYGLKYGRGSSWHCISALGCDALDDGTLTGEYEPIRTAEPVILCIMRRISENGWI